MDYSEDFFVWDFSLSINNGNTSCVFNNGKNKFVLKNASVGIINGISGFLESMDGQLEEILVP